MRHLKKRLILVDKKLAQILFSIVYGVTEAAVPIVVQKRIEVALGLELVKCLFYGDWAADGRESTRPEERRTSRAGYASEDALWN